MAWKKFFRAVVRYSSGTSNWRQSSTPFVAHYLSQQPHHHHQLPFSLLANFDSRFKLHRRPWMPVHSDQVSRSSCKDLRLSDPLRLEFMLILTTDEPIFEYVARKSMPELDCIAFEWERAEIFWIGRVVNGYYQQFDQDRSGLGPLYVLEPPFATRPFSRTKPKLTI